VHSLEQLASLVVVFWVAVGLFVVVVLGTVMKLTVGLNILRFLNYFREEYDRARHRLLGCRPAPNHAQAGADRCQTIGGGAGGADRLFLQPRRILTSKGAHGVPGSAIVILAATLNAVPAIPAIGLVLVLSIDWFIGMARALGNLIGNCVATVVIAAWENDLNVPLARQVLAGEVAVHLTTDALQTIQPAA
jgi:aerobic C4-dicarboxylate transport protein